MALKIGGTPVPVPEKINTPKPSGTSLSTVLAAIRKSKGEHVVSSASSIPLVKRLPTGIFELDFYLGGGFPFGRYSIVYGPESSNKTNICLKAVANAQKLASDCNKAVWVDLERTFDPVWAAKMGVDVNQLIVVSPGYGEEAVDLIDALLRADDVAILVVDSLATLVSSVEIEKSVEKFDVGTAAMLTKRMVNKMMYAFAEEARKGHFPCVLLINQTRFKPGVMFGDPETMPGGEAQKFLSSLRIRTYAKNQIDKDSNVLMFKETNVVVKKAKIPIRSMSFKFDLCVNEHPYLNIGDTDSFGMVKGHLQSMEVLVKTPKGYTINGFKEVFPTLSAIQDRYYKDNSFMMQLQGIVIDANQEMVLVEESDFSPAVVEPGEAVPVPNE